MRHPAGAGGMAEDMVYLPREINQWCPDIAAGVRREMGMTCGPPCAWHVHHRLSFGAFLKAPKLLLLF